ncbi:hypothetical protein [Azospirillum endophyticum]
MTRRLGAGLSPIARCSLMLLGALRGPPCSAGSTRTEFPCERSADRKGETRWLCR